MPPFCPDFRALVPFARHYWRLRDAERGHGGPRFEQTLERFLMTSSRRSILGLSLVAFLVMAPLASAAPPHGAAPGPQEVLTQLWGFLARLWTPGSSVDIGCSYDPSGRHCPGAPTQSTTPTLDIGCSYDPNGRCLG
jgi:hypothetical protein